MTTGQTGGLTLEEIIANLQAQQNGGTPNVNVFPGGITGSGPVEVGGGVTQPSPIQGPGIVPIGDAFSGIEGALRGILSGVTTGTPSSGPNLGPEVLRVIQDQFAQQRAERADRMNIPVPGGLPSGTPAATNVTPPSGPLGLSFDQRATAPGQQAAAISGLSPEFTSLFNDLRASGIDVGEALRQVEAGQAAAGGEGPLIRDPDDPTGLGGSNQTSTSTDTGTGGGVNRGGASDQPTEVATVAASGVFTEQQIQGFFDLALQGGFGPQQEAQFRIAIQNEINSIVGSIPEGAESAEIEATLVARIQPLQAMLDRLLSLNQNAAFLPIFAQLFPNIDIAGIAGSGVPLISLLGAIGNIQAANRPQAPQLPLQVTSR